MLLELWKWLVVAVGKCVLRPQPYSKPKCDTCGGLLSIPRCYRMHDGSVQVDNIRSGYSCECLYGSRMGDLEWAVQVCNERDNFVADVFKPSDKLDVLFAEQRKFEFPVQVTQEFPAGVLTVEFDKSKRLLNIQMNGRAVCTLTGEMLMDELGIR